MTALVLPPKTRRAHFDPPWTGDNLGALRRARLKGYRYIDQNVVALRNEHGGWNIFLGHWPRPTKDGYHYIWTGEKKRGREVRVPWRGTVHTTTNSIKAEEYARLRLTEKQGLSSKSRHKPTPFTVALRRAKALRIRPTYELKALSHGFDPFLEPAVAQAARRAVDTVGFEPVFITLRRLGNGPGRLRNFKENGAFATAGIQWLRPLTSAESAFVDRRWS